MFPTCGLGFHPALHLIDPLDLTSFPGSFELLRPLFTLFRPFDNL